MKNKKLIEVDDVDIIEYNRAKADKTPLWFKLMDRFFIGLDRAFDKVGWYVVAVAVVFLSFMCLGVF